MLYANKHTMIRLGNAKTQSFGHGSRFFAGSRKSAEIDGNPANIWLRR